MELFLILTILGLLILIIFQKKEYDVIQDRHNEWVNNWLKDLSADALEQRVKTNLILKELGKEYVAENGWANPAHLKDKKGYITSTNATIE